MINEIKIINDYQFQDMIISALRYALYRHTYIFEETLSWIRNNNIVINERVKQVMLNDIEKRYDDGDFILGERDNLNYFRDWLLKFQVKKEASK